MKIGFDAKRLYNNFTGLGNYSRTLLHDLSQFYADDEYYLYTPEIQQYKELTPFLDKNKYTTVLPETRLKSYWRSCSIKKNLKRDKIDIYHGLSHELPWGIEKTGIKSVVTIHDIIYKTYPDMFTSIDRAIYDFKFRYSCKHAHKIVAISESTKNDIIQYFGIPSEKIEVIYQAINPVFYKLQDEISSRNTVSFFHLPADYLLYVGTINSRKNLLSIVKAYQLLPRDLQIPLVVVGQGREYKEKVLKYAADNGLSKSLILINHLTDTRVLQAFYQHARIFLYPSVYEGFGLPVTEALLSKTPVITSNVSSLPEAGGPHTLYVSPQDVEAIAHGMKTILTDDAYRNTMIEKGYQFAQEKFKPQLLVEKMHKLYHSL